MSYFCAYNDCCVCLHSRHHSHCTVCKALWDTLAMKGSSICETKFYSTLHHCTLSRASSAFILLLFFRIYSYCLPSELHTWFYMSYRYYVFMCKNIYILTCTHTHRLLKWLIMKNKRRGKNISLCLSLLEIFCCFSAEWYSCTIYIISTLFLQIIKEMLPISS